MAPVPPKKSEAYFDAVKAFVVHVHVATNEKVRATGNWLSEEEATQRLVEAIHRRGVRVMNEESMAKGEAAHVNLSLELRAAADARRYGYRLSVTKHHADPLHAFDKALPSYLSDRRSGSISVAGHGGREADLSLIDTIAEEVVRLVPNAKRTEPIGADSPDAAQGFIGSVDAFVVRTRFDFDRSLEAKKGIWTAGSAKAYLTELLRERGLNVIESPAEATGRVAFINHWITARAKSQHSSDGFDYQYESFYAVTQSEDEYRPILDSRDKGSGNFDFFEEGEQLELERYADKVANTYRRSREALRN